MLNQVFGTIIENGQVTGGSFILCTAASLLIGFFIACMYAKGRAATKSFLLTLVILPAVVQVVIMMVNGDIGAGIAVAGAFSLVRFRSQPGTGEEISSIFLAMAVGLATGMGYIALAALFAVIIVLVSFLVVRSPLGNVSSGECDLRITVPETLDYEGAFDETLGNYTDRYELLKVKTSGMGSLYRLEYRIHLKKDVSVREMIDDIRVKNGNLEVSCGRPLVSPDEL